MVTQPRHAGEPTRRPPDAGCTSDRHRHTDKDVSSGLTTVDISFAVSALGLPERWTQPVGSPRGHANIAADRAFHSGRLQAARALRVIFDAFPDDFNNLTSSISRIVLIGHPPPRIQGPASSCLNRMFDDSRWMSASFSISSC